MTLVQHQQIEKYAEADQLPKTWSMSRIGDVASLVQYGLNVRGEPEGKYGILRMNCQEEGRVVMRDLRFVNLDPVTAASYRVNRGDLLFNRTNSYELVGRTAIMDEDTDVVFASYLVRVVVDRQCLDPRFLNFFLNGSEAQAELKKLAARGVSQANISAGKLREFIVPVPPLDEQRQIADVLDVARNAIAIEQRAEHVARELKRASLDHLFARGLRTEPQIETEFGFVPKSWQMVVLDSVAQVQTGVAKGRKFDSAEMVEVPYLRVANVQDGHLDLSEIKKISIRSSEISRYRLQSGDVVLTEGGDFDKLGRGFIWRGELELCVHQNHVFAVRVNRLKLLPEFFSYLAQSRYGKAYFLKVAHKTTNLACINTTKLKSFPAVFPHLDDQREIVDILQSIDQKIELHKRKRLLLQDLFGSLLHKLMSGHIRVLDLDTSVLPTISNSQRI